MEKKRILSKFKSFALLAGIFIFAFNSVGSTVFAVSAPVTGGGTVTPKTSAELAPIADRAISWSILSLFAENRCSFKQTISSQDVNDGKLSSEKDEHVGMVAAPETGVVPCNQAFKIVEQNWTGGDTATFLKSIGYEQDGDNFVQKSYSADKLRSAIPARMFFTTNRGSADSALLYYIFYQNFVTGCKATPFKPIGPAAPEGATQNEINQAKTDDKTYRIFTVEQNGDIKDYIFKAELGKGKLIPVGYGLGTNGAGDADCQELSDKLKNKDLATAYTSILGIDASAAGATSGSGATSPNSTDGCYSLISVFGWILCPMLDLADGIYGFLKSSIFSLLAVPELTATSSSGLKASWSAVKNIANICLILVALFMIGSQIFNFSFVDAYTVKKVLPKLVIAAILIQLSWFLFTTMVELFNALGYGLNTLVTAPFQAAGGGDIVDIVGNQDAGSTNVAGIFTGVGLVVGGVALATTLASGGMLTLALVAIGVIISILLVVFTLIIRKLLLVALIVTAPIALVAWILPNTQKFWNAWWQLFTKLLIMFPLIALLFAAGQIFAVITAQTASSNAAQGGVRTIVVIVAYFAPLFLIPATFKFAGGIFASIVGGMNNIGGKVKKGGFGLREQRDARREYDNKARAGVRSEIARDKRLDQLSSGRRRDAWKATAGLGVMGLTHEGQEYLKREKTAGLERANAEKRKEAGESYRAVTEAMGFNQQKAFSEAVATGRDGYEWKDESGQMRQGTVDVPQSNAMALTGASWLASDAAASEETRRVQETLQSDASKLRQTATAQRSLGNEQAAVEAEKSAASKEALWNQISSENAGAILKINPDQMGKKLHDLSPSAVATVKPATLSIYRDQIAKHKQVMSDPKASQVDRQKATQNFNDSIELVRRALATPDVVSAMPVENLRIAKEIDALGTPPENEQIPGQGELF